MERKWMDQTLNKLQFNSCSFYTINKYPKTINAYILRFVSAKYYLSYFKNGSYLL